ncbi:MAG: hypothetical protein GY754_29010 [bacterium]|nr:hypothetical protein [bacterium]
MNATKLLDGNRQLDTEYREALAEAETLGYDLTPETHRFHQDLHTPPTPTGRPANPATPQSAQQPAG